MIDIISERERERDRDRERQRQRQRETEREREKERERGGEESDLRAFDFEMKFFTVRQFLVGLKKI